MKKSVTTLSIVMINIAAIGALNNLSTIATMGFASIAYYLIAICLFFIPYALIVAELSSAYAHESGVYIWVKEAFGPLWGFVAVWLQWFENLVWYPTILSFVVASLTSVFAPELAASKIYNVCMTLGIFWALTIFNLLGVRASGMMSLIGSSIGILIPGVLLIVFGATWYFGGHSTSLVFTTHALAIDWSNYQNLAFLVGIVQSLAGLEMSSVYGARVKNPQKTLPRAILISASTILLISTLGSLAIASLVDLKAIDLNNGVAQAFNAYLGHYSLISLGHIFILLVALGGLTAANAWVSGPTSGLTQAANDGCLSKKLTHVNKNGISLSIMVWQGVFVSLFCSAFILLPSVNAAYWILTAVAAQLYLLMYMVMFAAAIKLRKKKTTYAYKIGGVVISKALCVFGGVMCIGFIALGFLQPDGLQSGHAHYFIQFGILAVICAAPVAIYHHTRKKIRSMAALSPEFEVTTNQQFPTDEKKAS